MPEWVKELWLATAPHLPRIAIALAILVGGWLIALIISKLVLAGLKRTSVDDRIAEALGVDTSDNRVERFLSKTVYYIALAFVLVAFFDRLGIDAVTRPIVTALDGFAFAVPNFLKALAIGFVGFIVATAAKKIVLTGLDKTKLVSRLDKLAGEEAKTKEQKKRAESTGNLVGGLVFWFVIFVFAIPVLEALKVGALADPLSAAFESISTYLPRVVGAIVLLVVGYIAGRIARAAITTVFDKLGVDDALSKIGLGGLLSGRSAGSIVGSIAMAFILLHFAISAVGRLDIREISEPLGLTLQQIYGYLPKLFVGALLMAVGLFFARMIGRISRSLLAAMGFNTLMVHIGLYKELSAEAKAQEERSEAAAKARLAKARGEDDAEEEASKAATEVLNEKTAFQTPADIAGVVIASLVALLFLRQVLETLSLDGLALLLDRALSYLPQVFAAMVVLAAGLWAGRWARTKIDGLTDKSTDRLMKALGTVAQVAIVSVAAMVALQQLGVGNTIIAIAFGLILGALCLALALAFGLGGREVAGQIVKKEYDKRQSSPSRRSL